MSYDGSYATLRVLWNDRIQPTAQDVHYRAAVLAKVGERVEITPAPVTR